MYKNWVENDGIFGEEAFKLWTKLFVLWIITVITSNSTLKGLTFWLDSVALLLLLEKHL